MIKTILLFFLFLGPIITNAQFGNQLEPPLSITYSLALDLDSFIFVKNNALNDPLIRPYFVMAKSTSTNLKFSDFVLTKVYSTGEKLYNLVIYSDSCEGMMLKFSDLEFHKDSRLWVYNPHSEVFVGSYSIEDINANKEIVTSPLIGQKLVVEYLEPPGFQTPDFGVYTIYNFFDSTLRPSVNSLFCMAKAICNSEVKYELPRQATCKILMIKDNHIGSCTGTLINNTKENGEPYILTANHCAERSDTAQFHSWEFHFNHEEQECDSNSGNKVNILKGADFVSRSSDEYSMGYSDFLLLKLSKKIPITMNPVLLGWDRSDEISSEGASFHHPRGDLKKMSKYQQSPETAFIDSTTQIGTHYKINWGDTEKGVSVTLDGSSGCALVNEKGMLKGTLTGGFSDCLHTDGFDYYGKLFYHWDKNSDEDMYQLAKWLDPKQSGAMTVPSRYYKDILTGNISNSLNTPSVSEHTMNVSSNNKILQVNCSFANFTVNIYNLLGQKIYSKTILGNSTILDLSEFSSSIYIVETQTQHARKRQKIFI